MDYNDLLPCPFCGGEASFSQGNIIRESISTPHEYVECLDCAACSHMALTQEEVANLWNKRVRK